MKSTSKNKNKAKYNSNKKKKDFIQCMLTINHVVYQLSIYKLTTVTTLRYRYYYPLFTDEKTETKVKQLQNHRVNKGQGMGTNQDSMTSKSTFQPILCPTDFEGPVRRPSRYPTSYYKVGAMFGWIQDCRCRQWPVMKPWKHMILQK